MITPDAEAALVLPAVAPAPRPVAAPPAASAKRRGTAPADRAVARAGMLFVAPALVVIFGFFLLPVLAAFALSFTDFDLYALGDPSSVRAVGVGNYATLLADPEFWAALRNTLYFVFVGGPLTVALSLGAALLLTAKVTRLKGIFRTVLFSPVVTTLVAVALVWRYLLHTRYGLLNAGLGAIGIGPIDWLGDPAWAMPSLILLAVWKNFGYTMLVFVAGLAAVPEELYEAARLDGAGTRALFRHVTLPSIAPTFLFVGVITAIGYFQLFAEPYVMTQGGPAGATVSVVYLMFTQGFKWWSLGYASAIAFVLFALMLAGTALQLRLQKRADAR